jgi:ABC-type multidrug transport system ATPase subunit
MHFLEAQNISYKINDRNILSSITFDIAFGELVKISGRNGSGKTTLLTKQTKGSLTRKSEEKICFLGHKSGLKNYLTVRENLLIQGLKIDSLNLGLLEKFNLKRHIDNSVGTLSFGQQKKLSLIRILNAKERIIILDEPFVGLDEESKNILREFMDSIRKENRTLIFTSHIDLEDNYREIKIDD